MKKSVLIGIIVAAVVIAGVVGGIVIGTSSTTTTKPEHIHTIVIDPASPAGCLYGGFTEGKHCSECGEILVPQQPTDSLGHEFSIQSEGVDPTCTSVGYTKVPECSVCGEFEYEPDEIPMTDHIESDWIVDIEATHTEDGSRYKECTVCATKVKSEIILSGNKKLKYELNTYSNTYKVIDIGRCTDKDIVIPNTYEGIPVTWISHSAFSRCDEITTITLPSTITLIDFHAFNECTSLISINIPVSVKYIHQNAFFECTSLTSIMYEGTVEQWNNIEKDANWDRYADNYVIYCTDGQIAKDGTVTYK